MWNVLCVNQVGREALPRQHIETSVNTGLIWKWTERNVIHIFPLGLSIITKSLATSTHGRGRYLPPAGGTIHVYPTSGVFGVLYILQATKRKNTGCAI